MTGQSRIFGARVRGDNRAAGLAYAASWRVRNKPFFDAIYGPEGPRGPCPRCGAPRAPSKDAAA